MHDFHLNYYNFLDFIVYLFLKILISYLYYFWMLTIIISDDLSGAAGMASLLGAHIPVIPYNRVHEAAKLDSEIVSIDLETRNLEDPRPRLDRVKHTFPDARILARIDSLFRGSTLDFIAFIKGYGNIIMTDTIPEYGRYTLNGYSIDKNGWIRWIWRHYQGWQGFLF